MRISNSATFLSTLNENCFDKKAKGNTWFAKETV